ncbi:FKBP-type peptidyl-prolyl cis-trans isomerase [Catellatospora sp. NPDC049133]|uniref:FKBP-type peptidyl-prolyl cis-trans isomerase n=1 Tax=Catellatospora sp. NPDC049133 TaxID=3155499 RepID=UPI0033EBED5F
MSGQVKDRAETRRATKAERRDARIAAAKAAKRRKILYGTLGTFVGTALMIVFAFVVFKNGGGEDTGAQPNASASVDPNSAADPNAADPNAPKPDAKFPPLPAGADPALGTKPVVTKDNASLKQLKVTPLIAGKGPAVKAGDTITVNYVGVSLTTGEEFDTSWKRGQAFTTPIGVGQVIPGWDQGMVGVKVGSRVQIDIPSELAYGDNGQVPGPLRFVVDVLAATPAS